MGLTLASGSPIWTLNKNAVLVFCFVITSHFPANIAAAATFVKTCINRVTRLGEFLLIGWWFIWGSFLKITKVRHILKYFFLWYKLFINFDKKTVLGYILGEF
jgi:hypothetical protein